MAVLDSWIRDSHTAGGATHETYRKGEGPGVVVIHEIPGLTPAVVGFAEEVVARGHTVVLPDLFGDPGADRSTRTLARSIAQVCISKEFTKLALDQTAPIADWLRSLARELYAELGGPGVGAVGMCFTGGYALAMMVDAPVVAPVLSQPSTPFPVGRKRAADVNLSPEDLRVVTERAAGGCPVLGLRYAQDPATGTRFDRLRHELGDHFVAVEFPGRKHSVLTEHRQDEGVERVLEFLEDRLGTR